MMNASNALSQVVPERIDNRFARPSTDARIQGTLLEHQHLNDLASKAPVEDMKPGGPGKELTAASALTSLVGPPAGQVDEPQEDFDIPQRFTKSGRKKAIPFPMKLMKVLSQPEYADVIGWLPDGKSFTIVKPKAFVADILPGQFKEAKYSSFTRKLHRWGFQRHLRGDEAGAFFHKLFQRGRLDLVEKMTCYKADQGKVPLSSGVSLRPASLRDPVMARQGHQMNRNVPMPPQQHTLTIPDQFRQPMHTPSQRVGGGNGVGEGSVDRLNAAIELEVNRRLKERIAAATLSRQALALMQQQQLPGMNSDMNFEGSSGNNNNMSSLGINLLGTGQDSLGLSASAMQQQQHAQQQWQLQQQQLQLQQLQQQQAQQQQQFQQQGIWGGQPFSFENNQGM